MILEIDTSKVPDKKASFWAELILISNKFNCTIDDSIEDLKDQLKSKEKK
jgi:hypothetical protein